MISNAGGIQRAERNPAPFKPSVCFRLLKNNVHHFNGHYRKKHRPITEALRLHFEEHLPWLWPGVARVPKINSLWYVRGWRAGLSAFCPQAYVGAGT